MAQLMQPLTGLGHQATAAAIGEIDVAAVPLLEPRQPFRSTRGQQILGRLSKLLLQKTVEPLLSSLKIAAASVTLQGQGLLQRTQPCQQLAQLLLG